MVYYLSAPSLGLAQSPGCSKVDSAILRINHYSADKY